MESRSLFPDEIVAQRLIGTRLPNARFAVVRVRGNVTPDDSFFWSFDNLEDAKDLCHFLVTENLGAYVFDTVIHKKVFELEALPS